MGMSPAGGAWSRRLVMKRTVGISEVEAISEIAIVDTFTKLIFGEEDGYSDDELMIIGAFRAVDTNVTLDNHRDMGVYLRALGVGEMIQLVSQVQTQLDSGVPILLGETQQEILNRRAH
jgi:hypothetical protein